MALLDLNGLSDYIERSRVVQVLICIGCAVGSTIWRDTRGMQRPHLALDRYEQGNQQSDVLYGILLFITFWILSSYLVPISLFVTIEIVRFFQVRGGPPATGFGVSWRSPSRRSCLCVHYLATMHFSWLLGCRPSKPPTPFIHFVTSKPWMGGRLAPLEWMR